MLSVEKLHPDAILPTKAHVGDLGYDLYALNNVYIPGEDMMLVNTGISCEFPLGWGAVLKDRSSVATKKKLTVHAGVIDNGYTGEIKILIRNNNKTSEFISAGEKIAQMVLVQTVDFPVVEVQNTVSRDGRGSKGFGSSGS